MIRLLLAAGVEIQARDEEGHTAAEVALMSGHLKAFEMLRAKVCMYVCMYVCIYLSIASDRSGDTSKG